MSLNIKSRIIVKKRAVARGRGKPPVGTALPAVIQDQVKKFNEFFSEVGKRFVDRDLEIQQLKYALLMREHILLKGKPGTAKSMLGRTVFLNIKDSRTFEMQLSKFMSEDYLFGPVNVKKLREEGEIVHNTKNTIIDANFAFLDEFFDGSDVLIRSLLEILNERTFTRNTQKEKCPLHTAILTSNFSRDEDATEAILDRVIFKSEVKEIRNPAGRMQMYHNALKANGDHTLPKQIDYALVDTLAQYAKTKVDISDTVLEMFDLVMKEYIRETQLYISDRTKVKILSLLKVSAMLNGREQVLLDDIESSRYALNLGDERDDKFRQAFSAMCHRYIVESRKEQEEMVKLVGLRQQFEDITKKVLSKRADLDAPLKIRELNKFRADVMNLMAELTTEGCKHLLNDQLVPNIDKKLDEYRKQAEA